MKIFYTIFTFLPLLVSCSNTRTNDIKSNTSLPITIQLSDCFINPKTEFKLSQIADSVSYVKLETKKESLLSNIIYINHIEFGYLIVDINESIFLFDNQGKFKWKINNKGRGPTEYIELSVPLGIDTVFKEIIVPDNRNLVYYDFNGQFLRKLQIPFGSGGVHVLPSGYYVLWSSSPFKTHLAHIIDRDGKTIKEYPNHNLSKRLNVDGIYRAQSISSYNPYGEGLFIDNKDTIWYLDKSLSLNPSFLINSNVKNFTDRYYTYGYNVISNSLIGFSFFLQRQYYLYDAKSREFYSLENMIEDDIDLGLPVSPSAVHHNTMISTISPISLLNVRSRLRKDSWISNITDSIKEDDNPIIRIIKLKQQF